MKPPLARSRTVTLAAMLLLPALVGTAAATPEGTMTWGLHVTLVAKWLDPADTEAFINQFMVLYAIHDAVVKPMPAGDNTPSLAESWTVSKDGLTYEFVLRKGVKFHNGDPVTAEDVKFSFDRYRGAAAKLLKDRVREVQIVDGTHLRRPHPEGPGLRAGLRAARLRPRPREEAPGRGGLSQRVRCGRPDPVSLVLLAGRGDRQLPPGGGHPDAPAHDGARRLPHRVARAQDQGCDHGPGGPQPATRRHASRCT